MDAVHFICLIEKVPEVLGEGGWRNTGNLIQAGLNRGIVVQMLLTYSFQNQEHKYGVSSVTPAMHLQRAKC